jgi:hypothetical protein
MAPESHQPRPVIEVGCDPNGRFEAPRLGGRSGFGQQQKQHTPLLRTVEIDDCKFEVIRSAGQLSCTATIVSRSGSKAVNRLRPALSDPAGSWPG